ncbi:ABC transporter substrate-binding protein [Acuticoccus kandeliae]|uniref:ABC transporter substrate-binding protein n=1 Tax=Acuticoccus kandeliae TaxID=2073160 RepID=UPI0013003BB4|nr:ABC transporter substrate-binding protein [Acuticoccus kandeliae]
MSKLHVPSFAEDCVDLLRQTTDGKAVNRRSFLTLCGVLGVSAGMFRFSPALAADKEIVLVNWGGDAVTAMTEAFAKPFMAANAGTEVFVDGAGPSSGKVKAMVESGSVTWDVADRNIPASLELGRQGLLEEIDYTIVDKSKVRPEHAGQWGVGNYIFSNVLTWDTAAFPDKAPSTWADFWNVKDFPGRRALRKHIDGQLEAALLADGVAPADIYPIDVDRALEKIKEIKEHTIFWGSGAESQQIFRDREVVMGNLFNTRASVVRRETDAAIEFTYNQGIVWPGAWIVMKNNPAGKDVFKLIASTQDPAQQIVLFELLGNGPINPAAAALVPDELKPLDPGSPENYAKQIPADGEWYADNSATVLNRYIEAIS